MHTDSGTTISGEEGAVCVCVCMCVSECGWVGIGGTVHRRQGQCMTLLCQSSYTHSVDKAT